MARKSLNQLSVAIDSGALKEILLFRRGWNDTEKGPFLFDDTAAASVLACQAAHNVDRMIDLEHLSLDEEKPNYDPDARGWCRLEVREGNLWAVGLSWNPDGLDRLANKRQRYLSPAFASDDDGRIVKIVNIALTALPATHDAQAIVSASSRKGKKMSNEKFIALAGRFAAVKKLADEAPAQPEAAKGKAAAVSEAATAAQDALDAYLKAAGGSDIDATFAALDAAKQAVDAFENAANALVGAPPDADAMEPAELAVEEKKDEEKMLRALKAAKDEVTRLRADNERRELQIAEDRRVVDNAERKVLVGQLVTLGVITPAQAWANHEATIAKGIWAKLSLGELREFIAERGPAVPGAVRPAQSPVQSNMINVTEYQLNRLRATHERENRHVADNRKRSFADVEKAFIRVGEQQVRGAEAKGDRLAVQRLSRGLTHNDTLTTAGGDLVTLSNPVQPIQQFGASSQRALEEFRLEFNSTLVSQPIAWAEDLGVVLPGGGLKDTYPLAFYAMKYREKNAQNAAATNPNSADVTIQKKLYSASAQAELIRITKGDFAYIQTWQQTAANMARARINLRNHLIADLLEAATSGYWGATINQPTGIDGQSFFSAAHAVNPFDSLMKFHGASTWSNYTASATPLSAPNLTAQKAAMLLIPGPDGEELGSRATGLLNPTSLDESARLLLTVQDLILGASASYNSVSNVMAQVKNEHYQSGFEHVWAPQLAGSDSTADYYLFSRETIGRGLPPWVLSEDASEEVRIWDESSDFYKNGSGWIKTESLVYINGGLLYPHGVRLVKGA